MAPDVTTTSSLASIEPANPGSGKVVIKKERERNTVITVSLNYH